MGENLDKIVDEWTYAQYLDPETYIERMVGFSTHLLAANVRHKFVFR